MGGQKTADRNQQPHRLDTRSTTHARHHPLTPALPDACTRQEESPHSSGMAKHKRDANVLATCTHHSCCGWCFTRRSAPLRLASVPVAHMRPTPSTGIHSEYRIHSTIKLLPKAYRDIATTHHVACATSMVVSAITAQKMHYDGNPRTPLGPSLLVPEQQAGQGALRWAQ